MYTVKAVGAHPRPVATCARDIFSPAVPARTLPPAHRLMRERAAGLNQGGPGPWRAHGNKGGEGISVRPGGIIKQGRIVAGKGARYTLYCSYGVQKVESQTGWAVGAQLLLDFARSD